MRYDRVAMSSDAPGHRPDEGHPPAAALHRTLGPLAVWGLGVGYVISGMYFGWNLGLAEAGPRGMLVATAVVTLLYACFVLAYAELASALPRAGGAFVYASRALGPRWGAFAGIVQLVEFLFAPPAIAAAIGAYFAIFPHAPPPLAVAVAAYLAFSLLNAAGVRYSAAFELVVTALAVAELLLFGGLTLPGFSWAAFDADPVPHGIAGTLRALPFAIWFYLAIEGIANLAEEVRDPQRDLARGFASAMATLALLAALVLFGAVGVAGWRAVVYPPGSDLPSDAPLPLALARVVGVAHPLYHLLVAVGLFGLVASFHGILLAAGRATFELGRSGLLPRALGTTHADRGTPVAALGANLVVGLAALGTGRTADLITISVFGALCLYVVSMVALFALRRGEPSLPRPFRTPLYPVVPAIALALSLLCLAAMVVSTPWHALAFAALVGLGMAATRRAGRAADA